MMLDSIKERIWRKHKRFQTKRARHLQITTPPSTFDIYMASSMCWNPNRTTYASSPPTQHMPSSLLKSTTHQFNLKNPLADLSLKDALNSSCFNSRYSSTSHMKKRRKEKSTVIETN